MTDTDSYLLKCTIESIEDGVPSNEIQDKCEEMLGLKICEINEENNQNKGD